MKPFKITNFTKCMLYLQSRKVTTQQMRRILIEHVLLFTRNIKTMSETAIYVEIEKIWKMPEDKLIRKFRRAMKGSLTT